jgi:hypothetical protein
MKPIQRSLVEALKQIRQWRAATNDLACLGLIPATYYSVRFNGFV